MCDKILAEEFVEIRVSFNGEWFYKSSYHVLSKAMCGPKPVHSTVFEFISISPGLASFVSIYHMHII